jgi:hypothetical protein
VAPKRMSLEGPTTVKSNALSLAIEIQKREEPLGLFI